MPNVIKGVISNIAIMDIIDILIIAYLFYKLLGFIRETRAEQLAKGILLLLAVTFLSEVLHLYTLHWILSSLMTVGILALVIIFQPELRRLLENLGRTKLGGTRLMNSFVKMDKEETKKMISELEDAVEVMSLSKTGALIVIERDVALTDIIETGTVINATVSKEMIGSIFYEGTPLHDGALIIRGNKLYAAGCVLPLTQNKTLSKELGTRHRAGIGITENSDAFVIIVSEETGVISIAQNGKITRFIDSKAIEKALFDMYITNEEQTSKNSLQEKLRGWFKEARDVKAKKN